MAFEKLRTAIAAGISGVDAERIAIRTQGCWNCKNFQVEKAADLWWKSARQKLLARAVQVATSSPQGESHQVCVNIRTMVPQYDLAVHQNKLGCCSVGKDANGNPVGDFVFNTYLCDQWSAAEGASVAREGQAPDKLPEELMDDLHSRKVD